MSERRLFRRLAHTYAMEYGPLSAMVDRRELRAGQIENISGTGVLFWAPEPFEPGSQLFLRVFIPGWSRPACTALPVPATGSTMHLQTVVEVVRSQPHPDHEGYLVGVQFLGQLHQ